MNLASALAQSSDVYFYFAGGGSPAMSTPLLNDPSDYGISGLGINRLARMVGNLRLGEADAALTCRTRRTDFCRRRIGNSNDSGTPWLLGDTYNVSIGQGDLLLSPVQLLDYIAAIGNGGKIYRPYLELRAPRRRSRKI